MEHFSQTKEKYESFRSFAHLQEKYPWAKAIEVVSFWYGKYRIPKGIQDHIANYLTGTEFMLIVLLSLCV